LELKDVQVTGDAGPGWSDSEWKTYGLPGFNDVELKPGSKQILTISGRPLLVTGQYGKGRTVAFTGFTPAYAERKSPWDPKLRIPYALDQEFVTNPVAKAYFALFMRMLAAVVGEKPASGYDELLAARDKPLFEKLKDLSAATLKVPESLRGTISGKKATMSLDLSNGPQYARLVRIRAEWDEPETKAPYLVMYSDNYFDLLPGERKSVSIELFVPSNSEKNIQGHMIIEGGNVTPLEIPVRLNRG
jgi:hypothetical protein